MSSDEFLRMRGDGTDSSGNGGGLAKSMSKAVRAPLKAMKRMMPKSSLIDRTRPYFSGVSRFGISKISSFYNDPFHTLLNLPWGSFILVFFSTYILLYLAFAWVYWAQHKCVIDRDSTNTPQDVTFSHGLWLSSRVASTLGFDDVHPDPNCTFINFCVMFQVIASSLINFIMLGVVFARFSAPFKRASTVRFSKVATVSRHSSGFWALTVRVANLRKHQILQPSVRLVVTAVDSITPSFYHHESLLIEGAYKQLTNLELGFPAHISHVITPDSFLYNLSLLEMDTRMMEILVFVDGIDAMTSKFMSARIAYSTSDVYMNEVFAPMNLEMRGKSVGLDFGDFDKTLPALDPALLLDINEASTYRGLQGGGLWQLRHQTFKKLAERYAHLGSTNTVQDGVYRASDFRASASGATAVGMSAGSSTAAPIPSIIIPTPENPHSTLLAPDASPSHVTAAAAAAKGMSLSTSGMPFAVARAAQQKEEIGLAGLFGAGGKQATGVATGGAWLKPHSEAHQEVAGAQSNGGSGGGARPASGGGAGSGGDAFIAMTAFQRHNTGPTGTAWQQSGVPPTGNHVLQPLGSPPMGTGYDAGVQAPNRAAQPTASAGNSGVHQPGMFSLTEEDSTPSDGIGPLEGDQARPPPAALPTSHNAAK